MPKHKPHKKHVYPLYRGKPVKVKPVRRARAGRPTIHPPDEQKLTTIRSTEAERAAWDVAAAEESERLDLPAGSTLTVGPWLKRLANQRVAELRAEREFAKTESEGDLHFFDHNGHTE